MGAWDGFMFMFMLRGRPPEEGGPYDPGKPRVFGSRVWLQSPTPPRQRRLMGILSVLRHVSLRHVVEA